jgi:hypothetical protein
MSKVASHNVYSSIFQVSNAKMRSTVFLASLYALMSIGNPTESKKAVEPALRSGACFFCRLKDELRVWQVPMVAAVCKVSKYLKNYPVAIVTNPKWLKDWTEVRYCLVWV